VDERAQVVIRGRCACGKRFRIRNAQPGTIVTCPHCRRTISISDADLRIAAAGGRLVPLQPEQADALEGILLDKAELRTAAKGSQAGLTGRTELTHEEAALAAALHGGARLPPHTAWGGAAQSADALAPQPKQVPRLFLTDLLASYYFAGQRRNALVLLAVSLACSLPFLGLELLPYVWDLLMAFSIAGIAIGVAFAIVCVVAVVLASAYVLQFCWRILAMTAGGDDEIPVHQASWSVWHDVIAPLFWVTAITCVCAMPAALLRTYGPPLGPLTTLLIVGALALGSFFWPVALMSYCVGGSIVYARPDWLLRCAVAIGPTYVLAWLQAMLAAGALIGFTQMATAVSRWPLVARLAYIVGGAFLTLYLGYVLFRTLGLLYRHFSHRFPWQL